MIPECFFVASEVSSEVKHVTTLQFHHT